MELRSETAGVYAGEYDESGGDICACGGGLSGAAGSGAAVSQCATGCGSNALSMTDQVETFTVKGPTDSFWMDYSSPCNFYMRPDQPEGLWFWDSTGVRTNVNILGTVVSSKSCATYAGATIPQPVLTKGFDLSDITDQLTNSGKDWGKSCWIPLFMDDLSFSGGSLQMRRRCAVPTVIVK